MMKLLSILSMVISIVYSQKCGNSHSQSTLLSISVNGASINKIGISKYLNIITSAIDIILPNNPIAGVITFGGVTILSVPTVDTTNIQNIAPTTYSIVNKTINNLSSIDMDSNKGNVVSAAMNDAISILSNESGQKYHIIFSAGNPLSNGGGTTTNPINRDDPCYKAYEAKKANIQTYVVLIGEEGINFVKEYYSCLVEEPSQDIIIINPMSTAAGFTQLSSILCKTNGYDVKITEVNPVHGGYLPFIEIFNRGASVSVAACWGIGSSYCSGTVRLETGQYFIAYNGSGSGSNPSLGDQNQNDLPTNPGGSSILWTATAQDGNGNIYDKVRYNNTGNNGISYWQQPIIGRSFELRGIGYNNKYGANWRASCYPNIDGSPGNPPTDCTELTNSCFIAGACNINGASGAFCAVPNSNYCECPNQYLGDVDTCISMPVPSACNGYINYDAVTKKDWMYIVWDRVDWDGYVEYIMEYLTNEGSTKKLGPFGTTAIAISDYRISSISSGSIPITLTMAYKSPIQQKVFTIDVVLTCSISTMQPTSFPTIQPTISPVNEPTINPTLSPTFDEPGVFIEESICKKYKIDRCECSQEARDCCDTFDTFDSDTDILTSGSVPSDGCNHQFLSIEIPLGSEEGGYTKDIKIKLYPQGYTAATTVLYRLQSYGIINISDFHNISKWTDDSNRRRLIERHEMSIDDNIDNKRRKLLETPTSSYTPSPTFIFGNKLNIQVTPPGNDSGFDGMVTMAEDAGFGIITLNITSPFLQCKVGWNCLTFDECMNTALSFGLVLSSCITDGHSICTPLYPHILWISVSRSNELCYTYPPPLIYDNDELPYWFWWILISLIIFLLIMAWLIYRFWWKQKLKQTQLNDVENELVEQEYDNTVGITKDLDRGDVMFNYLATGVPEYNYPIDPSGNELYRRQIDEQNQMAHVDAVIFQVRQPFHPVVTDGYHQKSETMKQRESNMDQHQHQYPTPTAYKKTDQ